MPALMELTFLSIIWMHKLAVYPLVLLFSFFLKALRRALGKVCPVLSGVIGVPLSSCFWPRTRFQLKVNRANVHAMPWGGPGALVCNEQSVSPQTSNAIPIKSKPQRTWIPMTTWKSWAASLQILCVFRENHISANFVAISGVIFSLDAFRGSLWLSSFQEQ